TERNDVRMEGVVQKLLEFRLPQSVIGRLAVRDEESARAMHLEALALKQVDIGFNGLSESAKCRGVTRRG
ncbi:MAG: hypothetical protein ACO37F_14695, partial [Pirellulales bacterium]